MPDAVEVYVPVDNDDGTRSFVKEDEAQPAKPVVQKTTRKSKRKKKKVCRWCGKPTGTNSVYCNRQHKTAWLRMKAKS